MIARFANGVFSFINASFKLLVILFIVGIFGYIGIAIFANCQAGMGVYNIPKPSEAPYQVEIKNTGNVLFADNYDTQGGVITIDGYWQLTDDKFKFIDNELKLDQAIFGTITVRRR
jgi:hypothetical protein